MSFFGDVAKGAAAGFTVGGPFGALVGAGGSAIYSGIKGGGGGGGGEGDLSDVAISAGKDYLAGGGPDPSAFKIGDRWTTAGDLAAAAAQERGAPTIDAAQVGQTATIDERNQRFWRDEQRALVDALVARSKGEGGPSAAELQMNRGLQSVLAGQKSISAGASGANRALAQRQAANLGAGASQDVLGQSAVLRAQEQAAAEQQLAGVLQGARGQDIDIASMNAQFEQQGILTGAQFEQQARLANQGAALSMQQMNDQYASYLMGQGFGRDEAQQAAAAQLEALKAANYAAALGVDVTLQTTPGKTERYWGMGLQTAGTVAGAVAKAV